MARKGKTGVLKRLREVKKAEKAALKREQMAMRKEMGSDEGENGSRVATADDLAGYGFPVGGEQDEDDK